MSNPPKYKWFCILIFIFIILSCKEYSSDYYNPNRQRPDAKKSEEILSSQEKWKIFESEIAILTDEEKIKKIFIGFDEFKNPKEKEKLDEIYYECASSLLVKDIEIFILEKYQSPIIAITNFSDANNNICIQGERLAEKLGTKLVNHKKVNIVDRNKVKLAMDELNFQASDLVDKNTARNFGKFTGATAFITGKIINNEIFVEIVDIETLKIDFKRNIGRFSDTAK